MSHQQTSTFSAYRSKPRRDDEHPDAPAVDRVGTQAIMDHFAIGRAAVSYWRRKGVPQRYRKPLILLGESLDKDMTDLAAE